MDGRTDGLTDEQKDERLLRPWEWMRMKDELGAMKNMDKERRWMDGRELKEERLLRPWEWMRLKDERGALKNMDEERRWMDGRTDERAEGRTLVEATVMDEDDSLLRR